MTTFLLLLLLAVSVAEMVVVVSMKAKNHAILKRVEQYLDLHARHGELTDRKVENLTTVAEQVKETTAKAAAVVATATGLTPDSGSIPTIDLSKLK